MTQLSIMFADDEGQTGKHPISIFSANWSSGTQQRILVAEDEPKMRRLLTTSLNANGYTLRVAVDGSEALRLIDEYPFDLLLLDTNLPGPNGMQVLEAVRRSAETPVLIISTRARESDIVAALNLGADDYMTKPFGVAELLARINALLRRAASGPNRALPPYRFQGLEVDFSARRARLHGREVPLTRREFEVLAYFARNAGKILLHRQVLRAVWGLQYGDESHYIWTVVQRIRRKIEPSGLAPKYLRTENGVGYSMPPPDDETSASAMLLPISGSAAG